MSILFWLRTVVEHLGTVLSEGCGILYTCTSRCRRLLRQRAAWYLIDLNEWVVVYLPKNRDASVRHKVSIHCQLGGCRVSRMLFKSWK